MAGFKVEQAVCHGRDFTAPAGAVFGGFLYYLSVWAVKSLVNGGPGWYMHDDQRGNADPYIVLSSHNAAAPNTPAKYVKVQMQSAAASTIWVSYFLYWDNTIQNGLGFYGSHYVRTDDAVDFIYDFRGGPECLFIQTYTTAGAWSNAWIDEIELDPNFCESISATTAVANFSGTTAQLRGIDLLAGTMANGLDSNGNMYIHIEFVSGTSWRVNIYKNSARGAGDLVWRSNNFTALAGGGNTTTVAGTAQNSSGVTYNVFLQGPTVTDNTIIFRQNKITVGTGEGTQFTSGNFYTIYDFTAKNAVNSFQVTGIAGDVLAIDRVYRPFPLGSKICVLAHNFFVAGTGNSRWYAQAGIPYYGVTGSMAKYISTTTGGCEQITFIDINISTSWNGSGGNVGPHAMTDVMGGVISYLSPDRKGRWAVQKPTIFERNPFGKSEGSDTGHNALGQLKNVILGALGTMSPNLHGRTLNGIDYLYFRTIAGMVYNDTNFACLFRESQSNS